MISVGKMKRETATRSTCGRKDGVPGAEAEEVELEMGEEEMKVMSKEMKPKNPKQMEAERSKEVETEISEDVER